MYKTYTFYLTYPIIHFTKLEAGLRNNERSSRFICVTLQVKQE